MTSMTCHGCGAHLTQPRKKNQHKHYCTAACYDNVLHRRFKSQSPDGREREDQEGYSLSQIHNPFAPLFDRRDGE